MASPARKYGRQSAAAVNRTSSPMLDIVFELRREGVWRARRAAADGVRERRVLVAGSPGGVGTVGMLSWVCGVAVGSLVLVGYSF